MFLAGKQKQAKNKRARLEALLKIIRGKNSEALTFKERAQKFNYNPCLFRSSSICNKYRYE